MPKLVITDDDGVREVSLKTGDTLGRVAENAIQLKVAEASRRHCLFTHEQGSWWLEDLKSSNGTLLNGRKTSKAELQDGDVIQVGATTLRFLDTEPEDDEPEIELGWDDDEISLEQEYCLILGGAGRDGEVLTLPEGRLSIGRKTRHMVQLKAASISGDHAEILRSGGTVTLRDLGSSNGTFVGGRRVTECELSDGDEIRFGDVPARFRIGSAKELAAEAPRSVAMTTAMEVEDFETDHFEVDDLPPSKEWIWNVVAAVVILGLGGVGFWIFTRSGGKGQSAPLGVSRGDNLLPEYAWSFEYPESDEPTPSETTVEWIKADVADVAELDEELAEVRSGDRALAIRRPNADAGVSIARLNKASGVTAGSPYRFGAFAKGRGTAVLQLAWYANSDDEVPFAVDLLARSASKGDWSALEAVAVAPEGAKSVRVGVGVSGNGRVVFDDAYLANTDSVPDSRRVAVKDFDYCLTPSGELRVGRLGRTVLDRFSVESADGRSQGELLNVTSEPKSPIRGTMGADIGDLAVTLTSQEGIAKLVFEGPGVAAAKRLGFSVIPKDGQVLLVTLLKGDRGQRFDGDFEGREATAIIVGDGGDRMKLLFEDPAGQPVSVKASLAVKGGIPRLTLLTEGQETFVTRFEIDFTSEKATAASLLAEARGLGAREPGKAMAMLEDLLARFPAQEAVSAGAAAELETLRGKSRAELDRLTKQVDDAVFFRRLKDSDALRGELKLVSERFAGTKASEALMALDERIVKAKTTLKAGAREAEAERLFQRARDYMDSGKKRLARFLFTEVHARYGDTEWAEQAESFTQAIEGGRD